MRAMASGPSGPASQKQLQRQRTREELRRCALARFARHGFDKANVADIVADAGVTERTFYRHFPTKESVLFEDFASRLGWFRAALEVRPASEPLLDAVLVAIDSYPDDREVVRQVAQLRGGMLPSRAIEEHLRRVQSDFAREIERAALARLPRSKRREITAAVVGEAVAGALVAAIRVWGAEDGRDTDALRERTEQAFAVLRDLASFG
jgi:AcrR family transcriptional regulator